MPVSNFDRGLIRPHEAYSLDALERRFGFTASAVRSMRRRGLPIRRAGKRSFVMSNDLLAYLSENADRIDGDGQKLASNGDAAA